MALELEIIFKETRVSKRGRAYNSLEAEGRGDFEGLYLFPIDMYGTVEVGDKLTLAGVYVRDGYNGLKEYELTFHMGTARAIRAYLPKNAIRYSRELRKIATLLDRFANACPTCGRTCTHPKEN